MQNKKKKFPIGRLVGIALIVFIVAALVNPGLLFFLTPEQQQAVALFQTTYFEALSPMGTGGGAGFDWLRLVAVALLIGECWAVNVVVNLVNQKVKLKSRHAETLKGLAINCIKYAVVIFAIIFGLSMLGIDMLAVVAGLGVLGLVVGFGAQTLIEDVITGLFVIFEGQFHVNDIITIDGFRGTVTSIGIRTTCLMDAGGNVKIINNSDIRTLTNLSEVQSVAVTEVGISYGASLPDAEAAIENLLERLPQMYPDVFVEKPDYVGVQTLGASSVNLKVVAKVDETVIYKAQRLLNRELKLCLDAADVEIPFPQVVVHQGK